MNVWSDMRSLLEKLTVDEVWHHFTKVLDRSVLHIQKKGVSAGELKNLINVLNPHCDMIFVRMKILNDQCWRPSRDQHFTVKWVADPLCRILNVVLVNDIGRVLLLGSDDLARYLIVMAMQGFPQNLPADGIKLSDKVSREESQVVFLQDDRTSLFNLQSLHFNSYTQRKKSGSSIYINV